MATSVKPGTKWNSTTCETQVMALRVPMGTDLELTCGGAPMSAEEPAERSEPAADASAGTLVGKRYVDEAGTIELLCVKAGAGSLSVNGVALQTKDAKPLSSSD